MRIQKKTWPKYFEEVVSGKKKFDMRVDDFLAEEGDILVLKEYDPKKGNYTGRKIEKKISRVDKFKIDDFGQKEDIAEKGIQIISFE